MKKKQIYSIIIKYTEDTNKINDFFVKQNFQKLVEQKFKSVLGKLSRKIGDLLSISWAQVVLLVVDPKLPNERKIVLQY